MNKKDRMLEEFLHRKHMMVKKIFTMQDQNDFASFSGDYNPIHINEKESIKTHAGQPIVHGVNLVLWVFESFKIDIRKDTIIKIKFISQVNLNTEVKAIFYKNKNEILLLGDNKIKYCSIKFRVSETSSNSPISNNKVKFEAGKIKPDDIEIDETITGQKINELYGGSKKYLAKNLFPYLVKNYGLDVVYEMACVSSIVGMKVPGNHSLFLNLTLSYNSNNRNKYAIINSKHEILKILSIEYFGQNFNAEIQALFRPKPTKVETIISLKEEFPQKIHLKNKKVFVIGGSRGLGAYVTKLCSIMGATVTFTYSSQDKEAKLIEQEIIDNGGKAECIKMNVLDNKDIEILVEKFDYIYYFATPKILPNTSKNINKKMYDYYHLFYVDAFKKIVNKFSLLNKETKVLYPSTSYIDDKKDSFKEYISAKIKGENICKSLNEKMYGKFYYPRIPPLNTDQNLSILPSKNNSASEYAFNLIMLMEQEH